MKIFKSSIRPKLDKNKGYGILQPLLFYLFIYFSLGKKEGRNSGI